MSKQCDVSVNCGVGEGKVWLCWKHVSMVLSAIGKIFKK